MFLCIEVESITEDCFLCMRRDVSVIRVIFFSIGKFSLHAQRCFPNSTTRDTISSVFSACAEMFPHLSVYGLMQKGFLCMRRDVSIFSMIPEPTTTFSLHAQRCFPGSLQRDHRSCVFSACAEMFLTLDIVSPTIGSFLCMRRDVSSSILLSIRRGPFSLHAQRCF